MVKSLLAKVSFGKSSTKQVGVHMENGLSGLGSGVEDQSILPVAVLVGKVLHDRDDLGKQGGVARGQLRHVGEILRLRHHEEVHRSLWSDVPERDDPVVFEDDSCRDLARNDAGEQ